MNESTSRHHRRSAAEVDELMIVDEAIGQWQKRLDSCRTQGGHFTYLDDLSLGERQFVIDGVLVGRHRLRVVIEQRNKQP